VLRVVFSLIVLPLCLSGAGGHASPSVSMSEFQSSVGAIAPMSLLPAPLLVHSAPTAGAVEATQRGRVMPANVILM